MKSTNSKSYILQLISCLIIVLSANSATADHVLLSNGRILYNVSVPDGATTGSGALVRVRTGPGSFELDPRTNTVHTLPSHAISVRLADYLSTNQTVGKQQAQNIFQARKWNTYVPRATEKPLIAPPPAPKQTPVPIELARATATPVPLNVVPDSMPLDQRLDRQLQIFMSEQTTLANDAATSIGQGLMTPEQVKQNKVTLLQRQRQVLQQYFPHTTDTVRLAIDYWSQQVQRAEQTGKFDLESL